MKKPNNVPGAATWNKANNQWELGQKNEQGKEIGIWEAWHTEGHYCSTTDYGEGIPPFLYKRFHPDGTVSEEGNWYGGNKWLGTYRWIKSKNPTPEKFPSGDPKQSEKLWTIEFDYVEEGIYNAQRFYDIKGKPVNIEGVPLPARPASVPERAHFATQASSNANEACWVMGMVDARQGRFVEDYFEWNMKGIPMVQRRYDRQTGTVIEEHRYEREKLFVSKVYGPGPGELIQSFYHNDTNPPVVKDRHHYKNNKKDYTQSLFDKEGKHIYSKRTEEINEFHTRIYSNDKLLYERITNTPDDEPVYRYYYPDGNILIDYASLKNGMGIWRLYNQDGSFLLKLSELNEDKPNSFLSSNRAEKWDPNQADWERAIIYFKYRYEEMEIAKKINSLEYPEYLMTELEKVDWDNLESAMEGCEMIPRAINGMLVEDEKVAAECEHSIWYEILHQGTIYEATYKTATVLALMVPYYTHSETIQRRLFNFIFEVLQQPDITYNKKLYKELINAVQLSLPTIIQNAKDANENIAIEAQYLLLGIAPKQPETETFFIAEWHKTENSILRRAYAAFVLGELYIQTKQTPKLITAFSNAFVTETNSFVRLVLAIQLVTAAKKEADAVWLAELLSALTDPDTVDENFYQLQPFVGSLDVQEYLLIILGYANPDVLEKNIEPVIEVLPSADMLKQETLLGAIFSVLFNKKAALKNITPIRKKALLAAAEVVDKQPDFLNHKEIFENFNLPHNSYKLRQLADKTIKNS